MPANQINLESLSRTFQDCFQGVCYSSVDFPGFFAWIAHAWIWVIVAGYALAVLGLFGVMYTTMRLFDLRKREEKFYSTLLVSPETGEEAPSRWRHIESLAGGTSPSEWREAIIEADIMLDDMLGQQGYVGEGVGEKLKAADTSSFNTLQDAWEAHKVRNQIAHEGSEFILSESLARRTIARYTAVFREFKAI